MVWFRLLWPSAPGSSPAAARARWRRVGAACLRPKVALWLLAAALPLLACAPLPATSGSLHPAAAPGESRDEGRPGPIRRKPDSIPWPRDFELGLEAARSIIADYGTVDEDSLIHRYNRIGYRVASQTGRPDIVFTFHLVNVPEPNAEALPGGFVFITKGMTDLHLSDSAIAMMLGHEMGHVVQRHFAKEQRLSTAFSLLQAAVTIAAMLGASSSYGGGIDVDPETGQYRQSYVGREAALQGASIFGSVFEELLLRGYSRGIEMEADEFGRRFAGRAGYPVSGSVELLEELHSRIYEDQRYGYWQTHPYFTDRIERARTALDAGGTPPTDEEIAAYREKTQKRLTALAASVKDESTALFLYRAALEAAPDVESAFEVEHKLLDLRTQRLRARKPILRAYGPLLADYDSLLVKLRTAPADSHLVRQVRTDRDQLAHERADQYQPSREILNRSQADIHFVELFLENFPDDPDAPAIRYRLAEMYRLSDRPDEAALAWAELPGVSTRFRSTLGDTLVPPPAPGRLSPSAAPDSAARVWRERSKEALRRVLPQVRQLTTSERIRVSTDSDSVRTWAQSRLEMQVAGLDSLELGSQFLQRYPNSVVSDQVRQKLETLAMDRYYRAKLRESMREFQDALDGYNRLILLAPQSRAAQQAREGVARIQSFAGQ